MNLQSTISTLVIFSYSLPRFCIHALWIDNHRVEEVERPRAIEPNSLSPSPGTGRPKIGRCELDDSDYWNDDQFQLAQTGFSTP